jgi:hypothetical protein
VTERATQVLMVPGLSCALCGDLDSPALHVPVITPDGQARMPRVCRNCLSVLTGVLFQLLGHAGGQVAEIAVRVHGTGQANIT